MFKTIKIWRLNRPVDTLRVEMIPNYFLLEQVIPDQISGWVNDEGELEIYDGFHRYSSANDNMYIYLIFSNLEGSTGSLYVMFTVYSFGLYSKEYTSSCILVVSFCLQN